jgi:RimJ/RimL family protein N-acetyltransferase
VIETARLRLRPHRADDLDAGFALWSNPATVQHISGTPSTRDESWARLLRYAGHWALLGFGYWAVEERASGRFVGDVGLGDFKRALEPSLDGMPEAGWVLDPTAHGRGYATEAARAALAWADANLAAGTSACIIAPENGPSLRVAEKCGFREWARTTYKGHPTIVLRREASR